MAKQHSYILGINSYDHDVSACLLRDGAIAYAIAKERITREKHAMGFHKPAADYVLAAEGITFDDIDLVVRNCYILPCEEMEKKVLTQDTGVYLPEADRPLAAKDPVFLNKSGKVVTISHHVAHAYSAFAACPFDEGAVMIVDGVGSYRADAMDAGDDPESKNVDPLARESESYYTFRGSELRVLKKIWMPPVRGFLSDEFFNMPGLGAVYSRASTYVFGDWNKCGELMGLAPYGRPNAVAPFMELKGSDLTVPDFPVTFDKPFIEDGFQKWETSPAMKHWEDIAWRMQDDTEKVLLARARWLREKTGAKNLVMAGGVALNCVANGKLAREAGFENVWIQPAAGDDGIAIGCAFYGHLAIRKKPRSYKITHAYFGREYSDDEVKRATGTALVRMATKQVKSDNICRDTAKVLAEGNVIGWFQGGSEFGPRALGHRSIIADPRKAEMKDILNSRVKHRQPFRPFAPIVLAERSNEIFEGEQDSPYMLMAKNVYPAWRDKIPAVVHVDGTARVQTVTEQSSPRLYRLLKEFDALTGVPVLVNTSFNVKGEPIVETPKDAMECFLTTGIHYLAIHDLLISKNALQPVLLKFLRFYTDVGAIVRAAAKS
jgi:carbamoyltransferase